MVLHEHAFSPEDGHLVARWILGSDAATLGGAAGRLVGPGADAAACRAAARGADRPFRARARSCSRASACARGWPGSTCRQHIRRQDPLISTVAGHERTRARAPGFGVELADWLLGAVPARDAEEERLIRAACHLADVSWRTHPDYRDQACVEVVTRTNVSSAGHAGRAFMAAALLARYRGPKWLVDEPILLLLSPEAAERAGRVGALMRLGCALSGTTPGFLPLCPLALADGVLRLSPAPEALPLMGEEVDKRLGQAAKALGAEAAIAPV